MVLSVGVTDEDERNFPSKTPKSKEPQRWDAVEDGASLSVRGPLQSHPFETSGAAMV